jgi:acetamidase/formamidase
MRRTGLIAALAAILCAPACAETHTLKASPTTVAWGHYDANTKPVLRIKSGDTVKLETIGVGSPAAFERAGVAPADIPQYMRDIHANVPQDQRGPGGHVLTGPIYVEGAMPGDVLEIRIKKVELAVPFAINSFRYGAGLLSDDFPYRRTKIVPLDRDRMVGKFAPGIEIPLKPFFGSMGVTPPPDFGRLNSAPPAVHGGNMDNKELVAGTTLYLPVYNEGGMFQAGDGHAAQGDGEVDIQALETSLNGEFEFIVRKDLKLDNPEAETPTHYIAMGFDDNLWVATLKCVRNMIKLLEREKGMTRDDAYMLTSVAGDLSITQVVDGNKGVHMMIPKAIFVKK